MGALPEFRGQAEDEPCAHVEEYRKTKQTCHAKLQDIWSDLELDGAAREQQVKDITERALGIWTGAVQHAENHRQSIRTRIDQAAEEMRSIAALLGESEAIEDTNSSIVRTPDSLHAPHRAVDLSPRRGSLCISCGT